MKKEILSTLQKIMIFTAGILLLLSVFVPIWRIELDAPQYPEGLKLQIFANKIGGDVEIINGLNHYIGMATLHTENFVEFSVLPYLLPFFALLFIIVGISGKPNWLLFIIFVFVIFGIVAMIDFYRWNYNYGHNLDPNAAIKVPGMAYQPPLIGYKQLLNFGAYSVPDIGGWMMITSGLLLVFSYGLYKNWFSKLPGFKKASMILLISASILTSGCMPSKPEPILIHKDMCHFCKMKISDARFGAEVITMKGRIQKYDDVACILAEMKDNKDWNPASYWITDYTKNNQLINAEQAFYVMAENFKSPMRGNIGAFADRSVAEKYASEYNSKVILWEELVKAEL